MSKIINVDLASVYDGYEKGKFITMLSYGDEVEDITQTDDYTKIKAVKFEEKEDGSIEPKEIDGYIKHHKQDPAELFIDKSENKVLKVDFVDVQQGDGIAIETPEGKVILIDGGDNQLFARYLANRFRGTSPTNPKEIDCIVVSHGDGDHFNGLTKIYESQSYPKPGMDWKKLFIHPKRVYHQGLVKRPGTINKIETKDEDLFGETQTVGDKLIITDLIEDIRNITDANRMNTEFSAWCNALKNFADPNHEGIEIKRISQKNNDAFNFLDEEGIKIKILSPILTEENGIEGLEFLHAPADKVIPDSTVTKSHSASHTVNGHSIALKLEYKKVNFLFAGDLNAESGERLISKNDISVVKSEVFKVPHHGSADFAGKFIETVNPLISIISSGDEGKDFIHPRSSMVAALGKYSRSERPLIFVTELVAFFKDVGNSIPEKALKKGLDEAMKKQFYGFQRTAFGIVKIRTNGNRLFVYTNSGQDNLKEAYAYEIDSIGKITPVEVNKI